MGQAMQPIRLATRGIRAREESLPGEKEWRLAVENQAVEIKNEDIHRGLPAGDGIASTCPVRGQWRAAEVSAFV